MWLNLQSQLILCLQVSSLTLRDLLYKLAFQSCEQRPLLSLPNAQASAWGQRRRRIWIFMKNDYMVQN